MGKASSAKKVARAARAGGNRRSGQRRALGFPIAIGLVLVVGLLLVVFARERRDADAFPRANKDHVHSAIDIYTCVTEAAPPATTTTIATTTTDASAAATSTTDTTTSTTDTTTSTTDTTTSTTATTLASGSTAPTDSTTSTTVDTSTTETSTTIANPNDVPGQYQPAPQDAQQDVLGIHSHGDGLIHIHPFADSAAGRKATLGVFLDQVGISMTNSTLTLPSGDTFTEGTTKCQGGKDGQLQVAKWDHVTDAAKGDKPNQIFTDGFDKIRLGANESFTIAFMPAGSTIPAKPDVADRVAKVSDLGTTTTTAPPSSESAPPASDSGSAPPASDSGSSTSTSDTTTTAPPGSASSSGP